MAVFTHYPMKCRAWGPRACWHEVAHLSGDTLEELHAFAQMLGLRREWFQNDKGRPHYDLTRRMFQKAVMSGAVVLPVRDFLERLKTCKYS